MSRLTAAQVISLGEYLEPDFNPSSLTVSQLLGVLGYHNVTFPTPYSKPKLVQLFNEQIKGKSNKLKKELLKRTNSLASDEGITDGVTGKPLSKVPITRRSSRRTPKAPAATSDDEASPVRSEPVKRRRSSAQPTLGGTTSRRKVPVVSIVEESESEEEQPVKKVSRKKRTTDSATTQSRRVSVGEDSGWEDNNIFQSGAEDSSPARPSPLRPKSARKSLIPRKSRKSSSAPPQLSPPPSPLSLKKSPASPLPQVMNFRPELPSFLPTRDFRLPQRTAPIEPVKEESQEYNETEQIDRQQGHEVNEASDENDVEPDHVVDHEEVEVAQDLKVASEELIAHSDLESVSGVGSEAKAAVSRRVAESVKALEKRRAESKQKPSWLVRFFVLGLASILAYHVHDYKVQSEAIGYCDVGTKTSMAVREVKTRHLAAHECNLENRTTLHPPTDGFQHDLASCPLPPLLPLPQPESCTPCPDHATCSQFGVTCDSGYLLRPNALVFFLPTPPALCNVSLTTGSSPSERIWGALFDSLNGLPGLGSVALPPRCLEDPNRKRHIGVLGKALETTLGRERGRRMCAGGKVVQEHIKDADGGDAKKWGVEISILKETMRQKAPANILPAFDDTFNEAIQQLVQWGGVFIGEDTLGHRYLAHKTPELTWDCVITVKARETWSAWKSTVFVTLATFLGAFLVRVRYIRNRVDAKRVGELVQIAIDTLRNQEIAHYTDPVTAPQPYISSLQLRDLILQDEHSLPVRRRLWDRVEHIVESNANVRANMEEVEGDELRVWRWVGSSRARRIEGGVAVSEVSSPIRSPETPNKSEVADQ